MGEVVEFWMFSLLLVYLEMQQGALLLGLWRLFFLLAFTLLLLFIATHRSEVSRVFRVLVSIFSGWSACPESETSSYFTAHQKIQISDPPASVFLFQRPPPVLYF